MYKLQPFNIHEEIIKLCCLISDYAVKHVLTFLCFITTHQQFIEKKKKNKLPSLYNRKIHF